MARKMIGTETQVHHHAFEIYYGMGSSRTLAAVAQEMGLSKTTIDSWSRSFKWQERVERRDNEIAEQVNRKAVRLAAARKIEYLDSVHEGMRQFDQGLKDGTIKVKSVGDAEKLVNMYIKLIGENQVSQTNVMIITASDIIKAERRLNDGGAEPIDIDLTEYGIEDE